MMLTIFGQPKLSIVRPQVNLGHSAIMIQSSSTLKRNTRGLQAVLKARHTHFSFLRKCFLLTHPSGHTVAQIRLIFRPLSKTGTQWAWRDRFLTYVHRFNIVGAREPTTQMHILKRAKRSNRTCMGDVIPISQLRAPMNLVPRFGATADNRLTAYNCLEHASELWLNRFWDKSTYFALSM
jgi:hypothetical protein